MASFFTRKDSPFFWIRFLQPDGTWGGKASPVRKDEKDARRKIKQLTAEHTARETTHSPNATEHRFGSWVRRAWWPWCS